MSSCEINIADEWYDAFILCGTRVPEIPVVNGVLTTAWVSKTNKIGKQALIDFKVDGVPYEYTFMISTQLMA